MKNTKRDEKTTNFKIYFKGLDCMANSRLNLKGRNSSGVQNWNNNYLSFDP